MESKGFRTFRRVLVAVERFVITVVSSNIVFNFVVVLALNYMWGMIEAQQILSLIPLIDIILPAFVNEVFANIMQVASFDYMDLGKQSDKVFTTTETEALSP